MDQAPTQLDTMSRPAAHDNLQQSNYHESVSDLASQGTVGSLPPVSGQETTSQDHSNGLITPEIDGQSTSQQSIDGLATQKSTTNGLTTANGLNSNEAPVNGNHVNSSNELNSNHIPVNGNGLNGSASNGDITQNNGIPPSQPAEAAPTEVSHATQPRPLSKPAESVPGGRPLEGKVALITGAGRGIGAGIARELAIKGCRAIIINYSTSPEAAERTCKGLEELGTRGIAIKADLTKVSEVVSLFQQAVDQAGGLDIVVSNSGREKFVPLLETSEQDFDEVFALNTRAQFFVTREAWRHVNNGGTVVLMSSIAAGLGIPGHAIYGGSKAAVESFTRCFAQDFGIKQVTVNCIAPAGIKSDMWASNAWRYAPGCNKSSSVDEIEASLAAGSPLNRCGYPSDIGKIIAFLASDDGRWINGQTIPCNGGATV